MRFSARAALMVGLACVALATRARADEMTAAALKKSGNDKMDAYEFAAALADYQAALKETPNDATLFYNIGRAQGLLNLNVEALVSLEEFGRRATPEVRARAQFDKLHAEAQAKVAYLTVACAVPGARVFLGANVVGEAPLARTPVNASAEVAAVRIEAEGYREDRRSLKLPGNKETRIECAMLRKATSGLVLVTVEPPGATISVDGQVRGNPPLEVPLEAGEHTILARRDGYEESKVPVVVVAGSEKMLPLRLVKSEPLTAKWWFWGAIGAVVVGGVVVTAALLTEKPADKGSIPPGQLSAPLVRF